MAVITTGNHPKALWPGVKAWWGREYSKHPQVWKQIFDIETSDKAYEEDIELTGFGLLPTKPEGDAIRYDSETQGYVKRYTNVVYGMGYIATREEREDGQYEVVSKRRSTALAFSAQTTKEWVHANVLNRAFTSTYAGGDGKEMIATDHPVVGGTQSNELAVAADLSEASLEDLCIQIMQAKNSKGHYIQLEPQKLIVPPSLHFDAKRIIESELQNDTANNAKNIIGSLFKGGLITWTFLDDSDAFFVTTNAPRGLMHFKRREGNFDQDNDFDTENAKAKFTERYACGWTDWRGIFGSGGA
jgi:phage major head subunit gpT-like protein